MSGEVMSVERLRLVQAVFTDLDGTAVAHASSVDQVADNTELLRAINKCPTPIIPVTGRTEQDGGYDICSIIHEEQKKEARRGFVFDGGSHVYNKIEEEISNSSAGNGSYSNFLKYDQLFHLYASYAHHLLGKNINPKTDELSDGDTYDYLSDFFSSAEHTRRFTKRIEFALAGVAMGHGYTRESTINAQDTFVELPDSYEDEIVGEEGIIGSLFIRNLPDFENAKKLAENMTKATKSTVTASAVASQNQGRFDIHVVNKDGDKASAMRYLAKEHHLQLGRSMVVGDGMNDIGMFKTGYPAVAMGNAPEEVKNAADIVIGTQIDGAFIELLERITHAHENK